MARTYTRGFATGYQKATRKAKRDRPGYDRGFATGQSKASRKALKIDLVMQEVSQLVIKKQVENQSEL